MKFLSIQNPTLNFQVGNIANIPIKEVKDENLKHNIDRLVNQCIEISKKDWDSFETSWDFEKHPIIEFKSNNIENSFENWADFTENNLTNLKLMKKN